MGFISDLTGQLVIDDSNAHQYASKIPDGMSKGYEARDWEAEPYGSLGYAAPFNIPLIPRSEWTDRIEAMERTKTRVSDMRRQAGLKCTDQNGTNYCHVEDTEVLTDRGWVLWPEYNWKDRLGTANQVTGELEFQSPLVKHVYEHDGFINYSTNSRVDFGVTDDHRMLVRKWDESKRALADDFTFVRAADIGWYAGLPHSTAGFCGTDIVSLHIEGDRSYSGDDFVAMLSLIISDGYAGGSPKTKNWVSFACFKEGPRQRAVRELAVRIGFREQPSRPGVWIRYDAGALAKWVRANCYVSSGLGSANKCVPDIVKSMSSRQIRSFLDIYGDQSHGLTGECKQYFSTSKRVADDIQELLLRVGKRGSVWKGAEPATAILDSGQEINASHQMWHVTEAAGTQLSIDRKKHIEREPYQGLVYCATVPNGTLVTRRNGTILVSSNCWCHGVVNAMRLIRAMNGQPFVDLSPASAAAPIKSYRNQGGWGGQAVEYIAEHGVASTEFWPANKIDRRYFEPSRENASLHKITEWYELQNNNFDQLMTCLLLRIPTAIGLNWWSHLVCAMDPVVMGKNAYGTRILNSWGSGWGDDGEGVLVERKSLPSDGMSPRTVSPSTV